jgi:hypothetical protein
MITTTTLRTLRTPDTTFPREPNPDKRCHHSIDLPVRMEVGHLEKVIGERHYACERSRDHGGIHDAFVDHTDEAPVRW